MIDPDALQTIAELAIAIAGFAGVAFMVGARDSASDIRTWRVVNLLLLSFVVVFSAMAPLGFDTLGIAPEQHARYGGALLGGLFIPVMVLARVRYRRLDVARRSSIGRNVMGVLVPPALIMVLALLLAAFGLLPDAERALYYYGLLFFLSMAGLQFLVSIIDTPE